jgi:dTDP-glucose 4,6-dehydratase
MILYGPKIMKKIVYITGCLGFIGSYITRLCLEKGWYVKGVDKITYAANTDLLNEFRKYSNFSFVHCDINDLKFLYDCDYVINTAAETHVGNSIVNSDDFIKSNIDGVHNLLKLIQNYRQENSNKPILLHISTDEVYGDIDNGAHSESDILKPSNPYSATKAAADMLILAWNRTHNIPYIIVRPTNNYGIGQYIEKLIPKTCKYIKLGRKIPLHNNGTPIRNWLHAHDTASAIITIIESQKINEIYNICGGFEQTNIETVKQILNFCGINETEINNHIDFSCNRVGQDLRYSLDDSKLRKLGWKPTKIFAEELQTITNYYCNRFIW